MNDLPQDPPPPPLLRRAGRLALVAVAALAAAAGLAALTWPVGYDLGLYVWVGDVVNRGGLPFRDAWDMHGPLVGALFAVPTRLFGHRAWGPRLVDLVFLGAGVYGLRRITRACGTAGAARWGVATFALAYFSLGYNLTTQPDGWVALLAAFAFAPVFAPVSAPAPAVGGVADEGATARGGGPTSARALVAAGLMVGAAMMVKPTNIVLLAVPFAVVAVREGRASARLLRAALLLGAAAAVPVAVVLGWFAARGALGALLEVHLRYPRDVYTFGAPASPRTLASGVASFLLAGRVVSLAWPAVVAGVVELARTRRRRAELAGLLTWCAVGLATVLVQQRFFFYQWLALFPPLAVLAAVGLGAVIARARGAARALAVGALGVILMHAAQRPLSAVASAARYALGRQAPAAYYAQFTEPAMPAAPPIEIAAYLRPRLGPRDGVAVWGPNAGLLWLLDRPTPFRLAGWHWAVTEAEGSPWFAAYRAEYLRSMRERPPAYFLVNTDYSRGTPHTSIARFPELQALVAAEYTLERTIAGVELYRRRGAAGPAQGSPAAPAAAAAPRALAPAGRG